MDPARQKRREEINKSLKFIQSSLAYADPEGYQDFLTQLVCNLLDEGNALFREREWEQAVRQFTEGLNVWNYAADEDLPIPKALLESLYVNRAAVYHSMGEYGEGVKDCDGALKVCTESRRALYRKALCLKELGKFREAYNCTTDYLLISHLDKQVNELAEELAVHLGLKKRKPYVTSNENALFTSDEANANMTAEAIKTSSTLSPPYKQKDVLGAHLGNGMNPLSGLAPVSFPSMPQSSIPSTTPVSHTVPTIMDTLEDSELMGDDLDSLLDCFPNEQDPTESPRAALSAPRRTSCTQTVSPVLPPPTPQLPPAFFSSAGSQLDSFDFFSGDGLGTTNSTLDALGYLSDCGIGSGAGASNLGLTPDALDGLDTLDDFLDTTFSAAAAAALIENQTKANLDAGSLDDLLDELDPLEAVADPGGQSDSLDSLDSFTSVETVGGPLPAGGAGLDTLTGTTGSQGAAAPVMRAPKNNYKKRNNMVQVAGSNPLSSTHEFLQACSACFPRTGKGIYTFVHKPDLVHSCQRDILLCRRKVGPPPSEWTRVRPRPTQSFFLAPFELCKELIKSGDLGWCKYGEKCTFAYNQLEIDVWTLERKGTLDRNLLFESADTKLDPVSSIKRLLQEHRGVFIFLCQECYDSKPRIISKRSKDSHTVCSNLDARHTFDANKCLAFVVRTHSVNYSKVRPLSVLCQLNLCHHAIRYGCQREDSCIFAHSVIELKTWRVQRDTGISPDEIAKISTKYNEQEQNSSNKKGNRLSSGGGGNKPRGGDAKSLNMKMKFACSQCWRHGLISEPDKALKYCSAKARHMWTKDRLLLLVKSLERSKWVPVRPLPYPKNPPLHYDICTWILKKEKCNYTWSCSFAHSQEEKEMWTYMKNNDMMDMQQMYDMWLTLKPNTHQTEGARLAQHAPEEKCIVMPTDYAEPMSGLHCRLCGKHSNSERQWQQHISTEKHKDRVFSCEGEDEALAWSYRFPGTCFELCPKFEGGCPDGVSCDYAHSPEELKEWSERRDFLRRKLARAREDMLIMPDELDFGKYNFLLQD